MEEIDWCGWRESEDIGSKKLEYGARDWKEWRRLVLGAKVHNRLWC